jgi:hypothetical protein
MGSDKLQFIKGISRWHNSLVLKRISAEEAVFGYPDNDEEYSRSLCLDYRHRNTEMWQREIHIVSRFLLEN